MKLLRDLSAVAILLLLHPSLPALGNPRPPLLTSARADGPISIRVDANKTRYFVGERIEIVVTLSIEDLFLEKSMIQLFRKKLDLPVRVSATWLDSDASIEIPELIAPTTGKPALSLVIGGRVASCQRAGRVAKPGQPARSLYRLRLRSSARRPGRIELSAVSLEYAHATRFREDFLNGRVPVDRKEERIEARAPSFRVLPLPTKGRPAGFRGAVGSYTITAHAKRSMVRLGETVRVSIRIGGSGRFRGVDTSTLRELPGFHVSSARLLEDQGGLSLELEATPLSVELRAVPPIPFDFFDPSPPGRYRSERTSELPLRVLKGTDGKSELPGYRASLASRRKTRNGGSEHAEALPALLPFDQADPRALPETASPTWILLFLSFPLAVLLLRSVSKRRAERRSERARIARYREKVLSLRRACQQGERPRLSILGDALALYLRCTVAEVHAPGLRTRLADSSAPGEIQSIADDCIRGYAAERYGQRQAAAESERSLLSLLQVIEAELLERTP